jgi:hypothetical protein
MEGVADADTGGGAREKWMRGDTGDRDGPARIGCVRLEYGEPSHLRQGRGGSDCRAMMKATP